MGFPLGVLAKVHKRAQNGSDEYGVTQYVWTDVRVSGCVLGPSTGTENDSIDADTDSQRATLYAPPGTDIEVTDEVTVSDRRWRVDGRPADYARSPFTGSPGLVVANLIAVS